MVHRSAVRHVATMLLCAVAIYLTGSYLFARSACADVAFTGVNLAGAEFKSGKIPGVFGKDYIYPTPAQMTYFLQRRMNTFRLPFRWERLQRTLYDELDASEAARIDAVVRFATMRGARVVLDVHNFARYRAALIGSEAVPAPALADLWARLATRYKDNQRVVFGLMNEPVGISARAWRDAASSAISSIRATGARNLILVPGTSWTGAHSWLRGGDGVSNGSVMAELRDPADNFAFEVHQYFDRDYSGTSDVCRSEDIGVRTLSRFTQWLKDNRFKGFLGEFGASSNQTCMAALENTLKFLNVNDDVWTGWTYWAAGAWWNNYPFSVEPAGGTDKPQMKILMQYGRGAPASQ